MYQTAVFSNFCIHLIDVFIEEIANLDINSMINYNRFIKSLCKTDYNSIVMISKTDISTIIVHKDYFTITTKSNPSQSFDFKADIRKVVPFIDLTSLLW
jgi:hypothetical protein